MTHHDFQIFSVFAGSSCVFSYLLLSAMPRTRRGGLIGLLGSALMLFAIVRGEFFDDIANMKAFDLIGGVLLLASLALLFVNHARTMKRRLA